MIGWLVHRLMPAAALGGTRGLPVPEPVDIAMVLRPSRRNSALAAPADFNARTDVVTRDYAMPAEALYGLLLGVAAAQERTFLSAAYPTRLQAHFVARSARRNLPGVVVAGAMPRGEAASAAVIYSASVYGWSDFGANRKRVAAWVAALDALAAARVAEVVG